MSKIEFFQLGFIVCLVASILFLLLAVLLFFRFHILEILRMRSGLAGQRAVKKLDEKTMKSSELEKYNSMALGEKTPVTPLDAPPAMPTPPFGSQTELLPDTQTASVPPAIAPDVPPVPPPMPAAPTEPLEQYAPGAPIEGFVLVKNLMVVHTTEVI